MLSVAIVAGLTLLLGCLLLDREPNKPDLIERLVRSLLRLSSAARGRAEIASRRTRLSEGCMTDLHRLPMPLWVHFECGLFRARRRVVRLLLLLTSLFCLLISYTFSLHFPAHIAVPIDLILHSDDDQKAASPPTKRSRCVSQCLCVASMHLDDFLLLACYA